jgi:hypothetical protein
MKPVPERNRKTPWKEFLNRHWELIVAADFFTIEVWTRRGLQRFTVLFFIELATRKVELGGIARTPNGMWMHPIGRNLTDDVDGILVGKRYLIHDRDPLFTAEFLSMLLTSGVKSVKLPPRSPNLNPYAPAVRATPSRIRGVTDGHHALVQRLKKQVLHEEGPILLDGLRQSERACWRGPLVDVMA